MPFPHARIALVGLCASFLAAQSARAADGAAGAAPGTSADTGTSAGTPASNDAGAGGTSGAAGGIATVVVAAKRFNAARAAIQTQTGASTYTIDQAAIAAQPGGENVQLNQVLLQAPGVVQDSFGQIHVRGDHNDVQYRLNGIIIPEGISVFGQTLDPRLISSVSLITGALPAEYGLETAGIVDLTTNSGLLAPGGYVSLYGGSQSTFEPSFEYGGSAGNFSYYVTGDMLRNDLGIESASPGSNALHDQSTQNHGFGYFEDILDPSNRVSVIVGISDDEFQIPNQFGLEPSLGLTVNGQTSYLSNNLNASQHELTQYGILTWQHSAGALNWQSSLSTRYTSLHFQPDWTGGLLFNGISQDAFKADTATAWQTDGSYEVSATHTLRAGFFLQHDSSTSQTNSQVLPLDAAGLQTSDLPLMVADNGTQSQELESAYLQDEWRALEAVTINYGLRFDHYSAYSSGSQVSPRVNVVWQPLAGMTVHGGYSRYFTPPPFELVGTETFTKFAGTTALPPGSVTQDTAPIAMRSDYYDVGVEQKLLHRTLTVGVDGYYETAQNLIDEGQFGAPIILTPFNYRYGKIGGVEFTGNYSVGHFSAYGNLSFETAKGKGVESSQFNFTQQQLAYIAGHYIALDHEQRVSASAGGSYLWRGTRFSLDSIFGTGLRENLTLPSGFIIPNGAHTASYTTVNLGASHVFPMQGSGPITVRLDVINLLDKIYLLRSGSGLGVFQPQYGAPRGVFGGVEWDF